MRGWETLIEPVGPRRAERSGIPRRLGRTCKVRPGRLGQRHPGRTIDLRHPKRSGSRAGQVSTLRRPGRCGCRRVGPVMTPRRLGHRGRWRAGHLIALWHPGWRGRRRDHQAITLRHPTRCVGRAVVMRRLGRRWRAGRVALPRHPEPRGGLRRVGCLVVTRWLGCRGRVGCVGLLWHRGRRGGWWVCRAVILCWPRWRGGGGVRFCQRHRPVVRRAASPPILAQCPIAQLVERRLPLLGGRGWIPHQVMAALQPFPGVLALRCSSPSLPAVSYGEQQPATAHHRHQEPPEPGRVDQAHGHKSHDDDQ